MSLDEGNTEALLHRVSAAYGTEINDVLLTALAQTLGRWTGLKRVTIDLEGHGREDLFLSWTSRARSGGSPVCSP